MADSKYPKTDQVAALRLANYEAEQARQKAERATAKPKPDLSSLREKTAAIPVKRQPKPKRKL